MGKKKVEKKNKKKIEIPEKVVQQSAKIEVNLQFLADQQGLILQKLNHIIETLKFLESAASEPVIIPGIDETLPVKVQTKPKKSKHDPEDDLWVFDG